MSSGDIEAAGEGGTATEEAPLLKHLLEIDPQLKRYEKEINRRYSEFRKRLTSIETDEPGGLDAFTKSYNTFGLHVLPDGSIVCREWCPGAKELYLWGEFNGWNPQQFKFTQSGFGKWELTIPPEPEGTPRIPHNSLVKLRVVDKDGKQLDRLSPWARYVTRHESNVIFDQRLWNPPKAYQFKNEHPIKPNRLRIYEAHVGISSPEAKIATYGHFTKNVLPHVAALGYNAIQLMAVMEHAYYASFGYQVTSFFAASSRYGTPDELKQLVDVAHGFGIVVLLDIVHSHASKNTVDGLNQFDGSNGCFFHDNIRGTHKLWDSRLFNYKQ